MSNAMLEFTNSCGIQQQHMVGVRSQQNGVAECADCVLSECIMAMLKESGLTMAFWGEVLAAFIHVWNRCPIAALDNMPHPTSCGMDTNQLFYTSKSGAALPMSMYRRTSILRCALTMRSASSLDTWMGSSTTPTIKCIVISEHADFDEHPCTATYNNSECCPCSAIHYTRSAW